MIRRRILVRFAAWAAWVAMLMASLAPAVSHALAARDGAWWAEVCSAQGARRLPVGTDPALPDPSAPASACGYCTATGTDLAVIQPGSAWQVLRFGSAEATASGSRPSVAADLWPSGQPRAPPACA